MNNKIKIVPLLILVVSLGVGGIAIMTQRNSFATAESKLANVFDKNEKEEEFEEHEEAERLRPLVKITPEQANVSAQSVAQGSVKELELENEDGNVVYEVTINQTEIFVDPGTGDVLYTQSIHEKVDKATAAARPRSSVQVPDTEADDIEDDD